jgi:cytochrome c peroxidase
MAMDYRITLRIIMKKTIVLLLTGMALLAGCNESNNKDKAVVAPAKSTSNNLSLAAQVGQKMFFDATLSGSGKMSCATCHDPKSAYGPPNNLAVQLGGEALSKSGVRTVPSLRYKDITPTYADLLDNPDGISLPGPGGGFTWDGRADTLAEQSGIPLLDKNEMANADAASVVGKIKTAPYVALFRQAFGDHVLDNDKLAFESAGKALQAFQMEDRSFHPYSSKFDLASANKIGGKLTSAEARGLKVFVDPVIGNCASCHYNGAGLNGSSGLFTDFSFEAIGVPRNPAIPANSDPAYFDLGVCGPLRSDHRPSAAHADNRFCGMFKSPTLRNLATKKVFFHNGVMHSLEQVIRFYNTRDTMPELWYPTVGGKAKKKPDRNFPTYGLITTQYIGGHVEKYNDLPPEYAQNIDTQMPLDGRKAGSKPPMTEQNLKDLICFLNILNDDYQPGQTPTAQSCDK